MKQQIIIGLKRKLLLVELPEGCSHFVIKNYSFSGKWLMAVNKELNCPKIKVPNIEEIGKLTDITESQFAELVDKFYNGGYRDYKDKNSFYPDVDTDNFFLTAKESFFSYLEKEGIYFENPLADYAGLGIIELRKQIEEAESKVWRISQTYLFGILN